MADDLGVTKKSLLSDGATSNAPILAFGTATIRVIIATERGRTLLQVKVSQVDQANELFETLMSDVVDPRREFIQDNALKVVNLDV